MIASATAGDALVAAIIMAGLCVIALVICLACYYYKHPIHKQ